MRRMNRTGLFPSNICRADVEGKRSETLLCGLKDQCVADAEGISARYKKELCKYESDLGLKGAALGGSECPVTKDM